MKTSKSIPQNIVDQDTLLLIPKSSLDTHINHNAKTSVNRLEQNKFSYESAITKNSLKESSTAIATENDSINQSPEFYTIKPDYKSLLLSYKEVIWFKKNQENTCYISNIQIDKTKKIVLLKENNAIVNSTEKGIEVKEKIQNYHDWMLIPLLLGFSILASILTVYRKYLGQLFEQLIYYFSSTRKRQEKNIPYQRLTIILDFLFFISFSLLVDQVVRNFGLFTPPLQFDYLIFSVLCTFLMVLRIVQWLIYKLSAIFSNQKLFLSELFSNSALYTRSLGIILLPLVFLIAYTTGFISTYLTYFALLITSIVLILRLIRMFRVFVVSGFSIFYFILYLCALEIAPLLFIWKEVNSR